MPTRRTPAQLKIAIGTRRADRHSVPLTEVQGIRLKTNARPPKELNEFQRATWRRMIKILAPKGLATDLDVPAIIAYCQDEWLAEMLLKNIVEHGFILKGDRGWKHNQAFGALDQVRRRQQVFLSKFGMTPSDRIGLNSTVESGMYGKRFPSVQARDRSDSDFDASPDKKESDKDET